MVGGEILDPFGNKDIESMVESMLLEEYLSVSKFL